MLPLSSLFENLRYRNLPCSLASQWWKSGNHLRGSCVSATREPHSCKRPPRQQRPLLQELHILPCSSPANPNQRTSGAKSTNPSPSSKTKETLRLLSDTSRSPPKSAPRDSDLGGREEPKKIHNTTESHRLFLMIPTQKTLQTRTQQNWQHDETSSRGITFEKEKPETNKKTFATLHETQDNNNTHHKPLLPPRPVGSSNPIEKERKNYLFH